MSLCYEMYTDLLKDTLTASVYDESSWSMVPYEDEGERSVKRPIHFLRKFVRDQIFRQAKQRNLVVMHRTPFNKEARAEGKDWPQFGYSMVGRKRLDNIQHCVEDVLANNVPGDFIETGVWQGGAVILMAALLRLANVQDRKVWAADSFEGLPVPVSSTDGADLSESEYLKVSLEQVQANFRRFNLLSDQVRFLKGWFCDTLPTAPIDRLAILRLDGDLYHSTMDGLKNLYHKVSPGGYVIVDDYNDWEACRAAVTDFLKEHNLDPEIKKVDWTGVYWKVEEQLVKS